MNPGDKVRVYRPRTAQHGWEGTLEFIADAGTAYVTIGGRSYPIHPADLQLVEEQEP